VIGTDIELKVPDLSIHSLQPTGLETPDGLPVSLQRDGTAIGDSLKNIENIFEEFTSSGWEFYFGEHKVEMTNEIDSLGSEGSTIRGIDLGAYDQPMGDNWLV